MTQVRHYHGTPIGGTRAAADQFAEGRFLLVPWRRMEDLPRAMDFSRGFIVDNSAFTFWRTGEKPEWPDYIAWCKSIARCPRFDFALIPDVIDGSEKENVELIKLWDRTAWHPVRVRGCPVWHMHESLDYLNHLVEKWEQVAIGSSGDWPDPGHGRWWDRMDDAFRVICDKDGYSRTRIHGLRMMRSDIIERYPLASADSTNAVQNGVREARKNDVDPCWGQQTIARRIERAQSPTRWFAPPRQEELFAAIAAESEELKDA